MTSMGWIISLGLFMAAIYLIMLMMRARATLISPLFWKYLIEELKKAKENENKT
ncbi:hypothetical protein QCN32_gp63 [Arthrobacter phage Niktson]|uniref:Uncharacterized protein n=2 Tax=Gordonvirus TaxID=1982152 RepID=A0A218M5N2_9CAUD|nr:hypothetical protein QCN31_gp64 [Arthrobacter phage Teacup]YP_010749893.1 hypothetical protein QCN32_gp63 [Arthrobacter phage Niktson]ASD52285.1 hypothetical protein NIKTSON_63 [Arthrobacter phage Niktson]ASD52379.1 hypothetical protein ELEPHANTMAN_63 [Arthrobacter phage ElephantMan]ASR84064.1 hypothetical protein SEA_TEACUP_64 [Arthrobacter phage Teacup]